MTDPTDPNSFKRKIPPDLQKQVEEIQKYSPGTTGPPEDLDEEKKRWLIVGICLHSIISPMLRKYVDPIIINLYNSLVSSHSINTQGYPWYLDKYPTTNRYYLNYESINNNRKKKTKNKCINDYQKYDYKVTSHVDLSKLFLQPNITHYSAIDESCDSSALLGMVINIRSFPSSVQNDVEKMRSDIRNPWAHCDFREWTATKYTDSFQLMGHLVQTLGLSNREENRILAGLNTWATNGQLFLSGTRLGLEIVEEISKQTNVLSKYVQTMCTETDSQFTQVQKELKDLEKVLQEMNRHLESLYLDMNTNKEETDNKFAKVEHKLKDLDNGLQERKRRFKSLYLDMNTNKEETDSKFAKVEHKLKDLDNGLQERNRHFESETQKIQAELHNIKEEIKEPVENHIPKHIRERHGRYISEWEEDDCFFVETRATKHILGSLISNNSIVVTGSSGCGKSSNIHHTALYLRDRFGFEIIPVFTGPTDIVKYHNINQKQVFVVDDICGKETINMLTLHMWRDYSEQIEKIFKTVNVKEKNKNYSPVSDASDSKLLISCRLHIYKESEFQLIALLTKKECNLLSSEFCLLPNERLIMMQKYLQDNIIEHVKEIRDHFDFFPLLCKLSKDKSLDEAIKLFKTPVDSIAKHIKHIITENKIQWCALVLCILFYDGFNTKWLNYARKKKISKLIAVVEEFDIDLNKEISRHTLIDCFNTLDGTFLRKRGTEYRMIHDKIHTFAAIICGQYLQECFIKHAPYSFIRDSFIFESITEVQTKDNKIILSSDNEGEYFKRLVCDLRQFVSTSTFQNQQLIYQQFIDKLIGFFDGSAEVLTLLKRLDTEGCMVDVDGRDPYYNTTPLIESASGGYFDVVSFLIETVKCDVNKRDSRGNTSLHYATKRGKAKVVEVLLQNNANVSICNMCKYHVDSPLIIACEGGYTDIVELLVQNKADVFECNKFGDSPLIIACKGGYTDIVELLMQNKASDFEREWVLNTPLLAACRGRYTDIVKLLLKYSVNVSKCDHKRQSPLYVACENGYIEIVSILLQYNADVSQCDNRGKSPLYIACKGGFKEIVELLLHAKAVVNTYNIAARPPLHVACKGGHTDIVTMLLLKNASVNQYNENCESPLYVACKGGHVDIARMLLNYNADVSQCTYNEDSPLFVACERGHTAIVKLLIQNNADISPCNFDGKTSFYVACESGHLEIVKLLLQCKSDVTSNDYNNDPALDVACEEGHTDIVKLLLQNNADIYQCNGYWEYLLYVACREGHTNIAKLLIQKSSEAFPQRGHKAIPKHVRQNTDYISKIDINGHSLLHVACTGGHTETVKLLIQKGADIAQCNNRKESPLYIASKVGHTAVVQLLLQNNADIAQYDEYGQSPLHVACKEGHTDIVTLLLENKADVFQCETKHGQSPLHFALDIAPLISVCRYRFEILKIYETHFEIAQLLIAMNADIRMIDTNGCTPLDIYFHSERLTDNICCSKMLMDKRKLTIIALGGTEARANEVDPEHLKI